MKHFVTTPGGLTDDLKTEIVFMQDRNCVAFLRKVLPELGLRWEGYRRVRRQVCHRIARRMKDIGISEPSAYEEYLHAHPDERGVLQYHCRVTISRFWRDRGLWKHMKEHILPSLAVKVQGRQETVLRVLSMGSASGEEPYTLSILWHALVSPKLPFRTGLSVTAVELDDTLIARAQAGVYQRSSMREVPPDVLALAFTGLKGSYILNPDFRDGIEFLRQDIRLELPKGPFHMILCRNLVFTYFSLERQREMLSRIRNRLMPGGVLVLGSHEHIPPDYIGLVQDSIVPYLYIRETD